MVTIHAEIAYAPYIEREKKEVEKALHYKLLAIQLILATPTCSLSRELQEKLKKNNPRTIAQAALIPGMTPAAISLLIFRVKEQTKVSTI